MTSSQLTIIIPMAGLGSRFADAGYQTPKPFIEIHGKPMIAHVLENLYYPNARYVLIARQEHIDSQQGWVNQLQRDAPVTFISLDRPTEGTACTVLYARHLAPRDAPLLIANCDQLVDGGIQDYVNDCFERQLDGSILTFEEPTKHPKWSYAKIDEHGLVEKVAEKVAISSHATVGLYLFSQASTFIESAIDMIIRNDRVNGEFYTCPVYNYAIRHKKRIGIYEIASDSMHGIGTPEDLTLYLNKLHQANTCMSSSH